MKSYVFIPILAASLAIGFYIYSQLPEFVRAGGPLIAVLITLLILVATFIVERLIVLWRAGGKGDLASFIRAMKKQVDANNVPGAIEICKKQGGCLANVVGAGLERYHALQGSELDRDEVLEETKRAIEEANALESPLLERNLIALSTIASVATMIGLLGTTTGMIKSFAAMSKAGAPDATKLALGISEALWNTALGLFTAIIGIIMYNYFTNRVDMYNYSMDETTYEVMQLLRHRKEH